MTELWEPASKPGRTKIALHPTHPERICWGCDRYCPANDLCCGNGTIRTQHPIELFGEDWLESELERADFSKSVSAPLKDGPDYEHVHQD